ncbi:MBL fold metallo-hydrolase [Pinisolibacter aquiterrae]|jgi:glyoxylase-like metal-dependent hydrolase (beta-lactamase superfamily II)|uniref:MBL fold metallo-hydrolase n=1 Tax=Pinisolibacter aquiterrae TaxID=2815579 RepID=UPI001C3E39EC|nr:MBL fold metallo-hydrolase [Pinisolibacter aquiterrae]MBV5263841.1 MBL fold metallo-hydrolase [Pinisolibacter aquiterrae]MCC8237343.1 MBL fold metallo-hydrolase [Pinisolibacter aquiterrae]
MSTTKAFASQADLEEKKVTFSRISEHAYAYTAEGDPNTGIVIGDTSVMVLDTQATPVMAQDVVRRIREVTDKPIEWVVLSHYHAVRVLGAEGYRDAGLKNVVASRATWDMIVERGEADKASEIGRFPRLFRAVESVPGLTWPSVVFEKELTIRLGSVEVRLKQIGRGHTAGDTIAWLPQEGVVFSGDLVEYGATPYAGDAHFKDWPATLARVAALDPIALVPGRGEALIGRDKVKEGIDGTAAFLTDLWTSVKAGVDAGHELNRIYKDTHAALKPKYGHWVIFDHCLPFDVTRAFDEANGLDHPRIWTAERDREMWAALEG